MSHVFDGAQQEATAYELIPTMDQLGPVAPGDTVVVRTLDSSGNQIVEGVDYEELQRDRFFPVVGPIAIDGVLAGDGVGVTIESLEIGEVAHTWTRPGLGLLSSDSFHVRRIDTRTMTIDWDADVPIAVPARPHIGALGVVPAYPEAPRSLGAHGGNLDTVNAVPGARLWFRAQVDGGGVFAGDVHAAMGDAEICGTGAETSAQMRLRLTSSTQWSPALPVVVGADGRTSVIGVGDTVEEALAEAVEYCVEALSKGAGMSTDDAHLAAGLLLQARICQVVNPRRSVEVSLASGMDRWLAPDLARQELSPA